MTDDEVEALLTEMEAALQDDVRAALALTADEFVAALDGATELTAARFSVSGIRDMWRRRVGPIMDRLRGITSRAAETVAEDLGTELPDGWDEPLTAYVEATEALLAAVGDRLAAEATEALAQGLNAGESVDELKARLAAVFAVDGAQLGEGRAARIAMTEATRAWNAGTLAAAQALTGPDRPLVKQWLTRNDERVRAAHREVNGQLQLLDDPFDVAGTPMLYPGDPTAPADLTVNCFPGDTRVQVPNGLRRVYRHWYEGDLIDIRTADGVQLSGTPNHPVLTQFGWKSLKDLQVGDKLVGSGDAERVCGGDPQVQNLPPTLAEVYRAANQLSLSGRISAGRVNFHGDVPNNDVDVVPTVGHLSPDDEPGLSKELGSAFLFTPGSGLGPFLGGSHGGAPVSQRVKPESTDEALARRVVGCSGIGGTFVKRHALHAQGVGLADTPDGDPGLDQATMDNGPTGADVLGNAELGLSGVVALHDIVGIDRNSFTGHVYNLETVEGWYSANGITSHNCRCILRTATAPDRTASMGEVADVLKEMAAAAEVHTGAMIALVPTEADAQRIALEGGEAAEQLHTTLFFLGEAADWSDEQRGHLISRVSDAARILTPVTARVFGAAQWNPVSDEPAWVWSVGNDNDAPGSMLEDAKYEATWALEDGHDDPQLPQQHTPWVAHITAAYSSDDWRERMQAHVGPVTFDRIRVAFGGQNTDIPLSASLTTDETAYVDEVMTEPVEYEEPPQLLTWSTPGSTALAFENQQTGDGRVFAPGALYWDGGPWPLQYAGEMNGGHDGARLAGAIYEVGRDGDRIPGAGVLYLNQSAGVEAAMLLAQGAPLGVSVDLDSVDLELVDRTAEAEAAYHARLVTASLLPLADGGWHLTGETAAEWTASGTATVSESARVDIVVGPDGAVPAGAFQITAAAGDAGGGGVVVETQLSDSYLMRITRARVRGATLVSIPAYANARITLDDASMFASAAPGTVTAAAARNTSPYERVVRHVRKSLIPVTAGEAARFLRVPVSDVRRYLARATKKGSLIRIAHGRYVPATQAAAETATAAATPVAPTEDAATELDELFASMTDDLDEDGTMTDELQASAWAALAELPSMPAAWFAEPTDEELPPGGPGVNYAAGRVFGWVAQAGEPHAGFAKKITIDGLGKIETQHFLRQRFTLDDGSIVKAGAFTMNVGHHRDGAECETASCQFDDTRTVAGIVTVGMNARGMWFSGAAAPWMSEWDRSVFAASQPSYHLRKGASGNWQLRAVLSVPVPGHSSPLMASAVVERSNVALTAAATMAEVDAAVAAATAVAPHDVAAVAPEAEGIDYDRLAASLVAAIERAETRKAAEAAELETLMAEAAAIELP